MRKIWLAVAVSLVGVFSAWATEMSAEGEPDNIGPSQRPKALAATFFLQGSIQEPSCRDISADDVVTYSIDTVESEFGLFERTTLFLNTGETAALPLTVSWADLAESGASCVDIIQQGGM